MAERLEYKLLGTRGATLQAGYNLGYTIADNCQQIANIAETNYRTERMANKQETSSTHQYSYDANGNLLAVLTGTKQGDKLLVTNSRKMLWDEDNHLLAVSDNGFVSNYWYDAAGERTLKESGDNEGVQINGVLSGARTGTTNYTLYVSPYTVVSNGGQMTKHIYMGGQRIASKLIAAGTMSNPVAATKAYWVQSRTQYSKLNYATKYNALTASVKARYDSLGVSYKGTDYNGTTFYTAATAPARETQEYFYHSDHLGSSSLITDVDGNVAQHIEYIPYGEVFIDERPTASSWSTRYKFNGKEQDEETGLYYYGARYYDPRTSVWVSVDPLAEKYVGRSSYEYCMSNPTRFIDIDGRGSNEVTGTPSTANKVNNVPTSERSTTQTPTPKSTQGPYVIPEGEESRVRYIAKIQDRSPWDLDADGNGRWDPANSHTWSQQTDYEKTVGWSVVGIIGSCAGLTEAKGAYSIITGTLGLLSNTNDFFSTTNNENYLQSKTESKLTKNMITIGTTLINATNLVNDIKSPAQLYNSGIQIFNTFLDTRSVVTSVKPTINATKQVYYKIQDNPFWPTNVIKR